MKHAVIVAHPNPDSFTASIARAYVESLQALGDEVVVRDLYQMRFDPCLRREELPGGSGPGPDVVAERAIIDDAGAFAFIYPLWFNAPPAILKGYADRVLSMGFGFDPAGGAAGGPRLAGRQLVSVTLSGAPDGWVFKTHVIEALREIFDDHLAGVTGLSVVEHAHFGGVIPGMTPEAGQSIIDDVRSLVRRRFGPPGPPPG